MRRGLIDKIEDLIANCQLFSKTATYPRRYFDDLMLNDDINTKHVESVARRLSPHRMAASALSKDFSIGKRLNENSSHLLPELGPSKL